MARVWLIRHAASTAAPGVAIGATDPPLSSAGRLQAQHVAERLADRPLVAVWSSDSRRAAETAVAVATPHRLPVRLAPGLREIDFGAWEGRPLAELWTEDPASARDWERDIRQTPQGFGEGVDDLERRVRSFWMESHATRAGGEVAIVGHRGSLAALRSLLTGVSFASCFAARFDFGELVSVEVTADC
ncbi:MAG TPA: histidine phosphatase family protein [Candidatus Limnocylindrales bacterium]|nr:histidine phosphatase family protein [Candidatus Limnocylindrales bacterium]